MHKIELLWSAIIKLFKQTPEMEIYEKTHSMILIVSWHFIEKEQYNININTKTVQSGFAAHSEDW